MNPRTIINALLDTLERRAETISELQCDKANVKSVRQLVVMQQEGLTQLQSVIDSYVEGLQ